MGTVRGVYECEVNKIIFPSKFLKKIFIILLKNVYYEELIVFLKNGLSLENSRDFECMCW